MPCGLAPRASPLVVRFGRPLVSRFRQTVAIEFRGVILCQLGSPPVVVDDHKVVNAVSP